MQHLIESLLSYAQAGHGEMNRETVPLGEMVEDVRFALGPLIDEADARVLCGPLPIVKADRVQLGRAFQNLIVNAISYRRPEGAVVIEISGELAHGDWQFAVKDSSSR